MKKYLLPFFALLLFASCSDDDPMGMEEEMMEEEMEEEVITICDTDRYSAVTFTELDSAMAVQYAEPNPFTSHPAPLFMDVYMPKGDTLTERPVMIWAYGGAFVAGERADMRGLARDAASRGFVSATIDYRLLNILGGVPDSTVIMNTAVKASSDMKAAIRHLRMDAETENLFKIDTDEIYVGGISAGAITALLTGGVTEDDLSTPFIQNLIDINGGINGNTGSEENQTYSSAVSGIINMSGAVYDINFVDASDPPIFSIHGDMDETVPYGFDFVNVFGINLVKLHGSSAIQERAESIGLKSSLITIEGGGHVDIYIDDAYSEIRAQSYTAGFDFIKEEICN